MYFLTYGTLKKNQCRHHVLENSEFISKAKTVDPFRLYEVTNGNFPAIVHDPTAQPIEGEVYDIDESLIDDLDAIEGVHLRNPLYNREVRKVKLEDGSVKDAIVYVWNRSTKGYKDCGTSWPPVGE